MEYSKDELLTVLMSREVRNEDVALVGVATPLAAAACFLAKATIAPKVTLMYAGTINPAVHDIATTFRHPERLGPISQGPISQLTLLDQIQRGRFTLQFISPAQIDQRGSINNSVIGEYKRPKVRLPGPLALPDITLVMGRLVIYVPSHDVRTLSERVDFVTAAGHLEEGKWRKRMAIRGAGPVRVISDLGIFDFAGDNKRLTLRSLHQGVTLAEVSARTGFKIEFSEQVELTVEPTKVELEVLRNTVDPSGLRKMELKEYRQGVMQRVFSTHE